MTATRVVRLSCGEENTGSRRAIEAHGGVFLRRCEASWYADHPYVMDEFRVI